RLLQIQSTKWYQSDCLIRGRRAHVGKFLLANGIDVEVVIARVLTDNHTLVNFHSGTDKQLAALLKIPQRICGGGTVTIGDQRPGNAMRNFALPLDVAIK